MTIPRKPVGSNKPFIISPVGSDDQQRTKFESPDGVAARVPPPVSPSLPPQATQQFSNPEAARADSTTDAVNPAPGNERFSTLEYDPVATQRASMYKDDSRDVSDSIQFTYGHSRGASDSSLPPYQQNSKRFTTLPEALETTKEEQEQRSRNEDMEESREKAVAGGFMSKRLCGLEMKAALIIAAILLLVIIGAVIGGIVGSQRAKSSAKGIDPVITSDAARADSTSSPSTITSGLLSSTKTSSATRTSKSASTTASNDGFNGVYLPLRTQDPGYLDPDTDFFSPEDWQTIKLFQSRLAVEASYDRNIRLGSPNMAVSEVGENSQLWQMRPVPPFWENSTFKTSTGWSRCYWIANRQIGPGVRLSQDVSDQNWKDAVRNRNTTTVYPLVQMAAANVHDEAQYWYFQRAYQKVDKGQSTVPMYRMYNRAGSNQFRFAYNDSWKNKPKMISEDVSPKKWDWWDIEMAGVVGSDIPLGTTENWVTKVEKPTV